MTSNRLAEAFHGLVRREVPDRLEEIDRVNREHEDDYDLCSTHDFCDPNVLMAEAFELVESREVDLCSAVDCGLWNEAWTEAINVGFSREWPI